MTVGCDTSNDRRPGHAGERVTTLWWTSEPPETRGGSYRLVTPPSGEVRLRMANGRTSRLSTQGDTGGRLVRKSKTDDLVQFGLPPVDDRSTKRYVIASQMIVGLGHAGSVLLVAGTRNDAQLLARGSARPGGPSRCCRRQQAAARHHQTPLAVCAMAFHCHAGRLQMTGPGWPGAGPGRRNQGRGGPAWLPRWWPCPARGVRRRRLRPAPRSPSACASRCRDAITAGQCARRGSAGRRAHVLDGRVPGQQARTAGPGPPADRPDMPGRRPA
jgi:hypothetical protein